MTITRPDRLAEIRWSICVSKSQRSMCVPFSWTDSGLCIYHSFIWLHLNILHNSQWITFRTQSCLIFFALICCVCLLYDWSFRLSHHVIYTCYFISSCLFLLEHSSSLWRCFVLMFLWHFRHLPFWLSFQINFRIIAQNIRWAFNKFPDFLYRHLKLS